MSAFKPIPPRSAIDVFEAAGIHDGASVVAALAEAGVVKAYARMTERVSPSGVRQSVRDKRIAPELWRRIIAEGKTDDVLGGTVRLDGSAEFGGGAKIALIGIRFDPDTVGQAAADHGPDAPKASVRRTVAHVSPTVADATVAMNEPVVRQPRRIAIADGAELVSIEDAITILDVGRTKLYELIKAETLAVKKIGRATRVYRDSIDKFLGKSA